MKDDTISRAAAVDTVERMYKACEGSLSDYHDLLAAAFMDLTPAHGDGDTISRAAAIDAIKKCTDIFLNNLPPTIYKEDAIKAVKALPSAQPGWIPVTEKPIEGGQYIVTLKDDKEVWTDIAEWNPTFGGRWQAEFFDCEYRDINNVVAWQPLPTPYREGGQDG